MNENFGGRGRKLVVPYCVPRNPDGFRVPSLRIDAAAVLTSHAE